MILKQKSSINKEVYDFLRMEIMLAKIEPGEKVSETNLGKRFNVSRTPIREALISLSQEGLVNIYPQQKTTVTKISYEEVIQAQFIRESLETSVLNHLINIMSKEKVLILEEIIERQTMSLRFNNYTEFFTLDENLHEEFANLSGYSKVWDVIKKVKVPIDRIRMLSLPYPEEIEHMIFQHKNLIHALQEGNKEKIDKEIKHHLNEVFLSIKKLPKKYYQYFTK